MTRQPPPEKRMLETGLEEVLGGQTPPDLSEAIVRRLAESAQARPATHTSTHATPRRQRGPMLSGLLVGAAAATLVAAWFGAFTTNHTSQEAVEVTIRRGEVARWHNDSWLKQPPPGRTTFAIRTGERLRSGPIPWTDLELGTLGVLAMAEASEIEVLDMNWNDFTKGAALGSITVAVVVGGISWASGSSASEAVAGEKLVLARGDNESTRMTAEESTELREQLAAANARIEEMENAPIRSNLARATAEDPEPTPEAEGNSTSAPAFHYTGLDEALGVIDWDTFGQATADMLPLLAELTETMRQGGELPLDLAGKIQALNGKLLGQAQLIMDGKIPGVGVNGPFTHPLVAANQMNAVFEHSGTPMTDTQKQGLQTLAAHYAGEDAQRLAGYSADTPKLQVVIDELALKERFFAESKNLFTPEQLAIVSNPVTSGYTGVELIGTGVAWAPYAAPVPSADRTDYAKRFSQRVSGSFGMDAGQRSQIADIVTRWSENFPDEYWEAGTGNLNAMQFFKVDRVKQAAQVQMGIIQEVLSTMELTPEQRKKVMQGVKVPLPIPR